MIEEGLFDAIGKLFKKGADKAGAAAASNEETAELYRSGIKNVIDMPDEYQSVLDQAEFLRDEMKSAETYRKIEELCKSAEDICANLAEKEAELYKTISDKMKAANEAVKEFTEKAIAKIKEIIEISKNKVSDAVSAVIIFCKKMAEVAKKALEKIGEGVVIAFSLPFLFAFAVYKGTLKICEAIVEKVKDGAKVVKEAFVKVKNTIVGWATDMLKQAKDVLKKACDAVKDGAAAAYKAIGKTFLAIVAILGQLASDAKDAIKEAYNSFVEGVKEFADEVKAYVKEKWDVVANWCKKTSTAFAEGVKNVWDKMKEKVTAAVGAVKDAYQTLKDNAKATWDEIKKWNDERQQEDIKAKMKYAADKWGKDKVSSWIDEL
jgi:phage-related protein